MLATVAVALLGACGDSTLGACAKQPDVSGKWNLSLTPVPDGGVPTIPRSDVVYATIEQVKPQGVLSLGRLIRGMLSSMDSGFFSSLTIPPLTHNDGSKTGSLLGCAISIHIPVAPDVSDDNVDQGPLKIGLSGTIVDKGMMVGDPTTSTVILDEDAQKTPRSFAWTAVEQP